MFECPCVSIVSNVYLQVWTKGLRIIQIDLPLLIDALFCAAAGMISFGALLGRVSPTQLTLVLLLEVSMLERQNLMYKSYTSGMNAIYVLLST